MQWREKGILRGQITDTSSAYSDPAGLAPRPKQHIRGLATQDFTNTAFRYSWLLNQALQSFTSLLLVNLFSILSTNTCGRFFLRSFFSLIGGTFPSSRESPHPGSTQRFCRDPSLSPLATTPCSSRRWCCCCRRRSDRIGRMQRAFEASQCCCSNAASTIGRRRFCISALARQVRKRTMCVELIGHFNHA